MIRNLVPKGASEVTPSDTTDLTGTSYLYVGGTGDVSVVTEKGDTAIFQDVPAGTLLGPLSITKVKQTGTDATKITRFYE